MASTPLSPASGTSRVTKLLQAMFRHLVDAFVRSQEAVEECADPIDELLLLALAYRETALRHRHLYRRLYGPAIEGVESDPELAAGLGRALGRGMEAISRCVEGGRFRQGDPAAIALQLHALLHGLATFELSGFFGDARQSDVARGRGSAAQRALRAMPIT